jgi:predicted ester cyclase
MVAANGGGSAMPHRLEANKDVVRAYAEAYGAGDLDRLVGLFTPDAVVHGVLGWGRMDVVVPVWRELFAAFRPILAIEDLLAEGDSVAARLLESGTFLGSFRGQAPTGRSYEVVAMEWFELRDGLIRRRWGARDFSAVARQIGLTLPG